MNSRFGKEISDKASGKSFYESKKLYSRMISLKITLGPQLRKINLSFPMKILQE